jgi:hypothetical protein
MGIKVGETPILRGSPPIQRTLEVLVDENWLVGERLEKCVSFQEIAHANGRVAVIFSRSVSPTEARAFAELLMAAADLLETHNKSPPEPEK